MSDFDDVLNETKLAPKRAPKPKTEKVVMTKELMVQQVGVELTDLREQAQNLMKIVSDLEVATRADAAAQTVETISEVLKDFKDIRPSLERIKKVMKARVLERVK